MRPRVPWRVEKQCKWVVGRQMPDSNGYNVRSVQNVVRAVQRPEGF